MKRVIAILLLSIFIAGQVNLTWANHYCMSFKVKSALMFGQGSLDCGMFEMMDCEYDGRGHENTEFQNTSCCSNIYMTSDSDDFFEDQKINPIKQLSFTAAFSESFLSHSQGSDHKINFIIPAPPLIQLNQQVMYQSFLL